MNTAQDIKDALKHTMSEIGVTPPSISLEHPTDLKNGDYSSNVAMVAMRLIAQTFNDHVHSVIWNRFQGSNPIDLARYLKEKLDGQIEGVEKIEIAKPGFINFYLSSKTISKAVEEARTSEKWGANKIGDGKKVMVEYTDPNPFKEFHIGHLMSNAIGETFARLLEFSGAKVLRANYQGDVGLHVAKALFVLLEKDTASPTSAEIGASYTEGAKRYEESEEDKKKIDELNKTIYQRTDEKVNSLYDHGRTTCLEAFEKLYKTLGTKFDHYFFESESGPRGLKIVKAHTEIFEESEGAVIFRGEKYGLHTRVFINKVGLPTYEAKDVGLAELKQEYADVERSITVTATEQKDYFAVVKQAIELALPELAGKIEHRAHGMMRFADGKMSSRTGNVITGESLINDLSEAARERAKESRAENPEKLAEQVAIAAIKYQVLKQASDKDIIFNREQALSLEGDSGPYLQYAHARASAIVEKAREQNISAKADSSVKPNTVARLLARFPDIVERATSNLEPQLVATYLINFASAFNSWYANEHILDGTPASAHKVALTDAARVTLKNGLWLLGIPAPEKM